MRGLRGYLRFLLKHKALSAINILGLSIGFATCIFISLYVSHELSYDRYHKNIDRIFAITTKFWTDKSLDQISTTSSILFSELRDNYPEVEDVVRLKPLHNPTVSFDGKFFKEGDIDIYEADPKIFEFFTYHLLKGNPQTVLTGTNSMVITESLAMKYFGKDDPMNRTLTLNKKEYQITGILEDVPSNSDLRFAALVSMDRNRKEEWWDFDHYVYVLFNGEYLKADKGATLFGKKLAKVSEAKFNEELKKFNQNMTVNLLIEPLKDVHFRTGLYDDTPKGNRKYISILASVAMLILFIGSLNFINFSLVQSIERGKEVGIRKVVGAKHAGLVFRYLSESIFITMFAFLIAMLLVILLMPMFNDITGKSFQFKDLLSIKSIGLSLVVVIIVGTLAGSYPAFFTSSIKPLESLKGKMANAGGAGFRKVSIIAQFAIAMGLIICTLVIYRQMQFISNYDLGFRKNNIVIVNPPIDSAYSGKLKIFKEVLLRNSAIQGVSLLGRGALPAVYGAKTTVQTKVGGQTRVVNFSTIDEHYLPVLEIALKEGRNFEVARPGDKTDVFIINESFAKLWGWEDPLNETILWGNTDVKVIGVTKDFHFSSLHNTIEPAMFFFKDNAVVSNVAVSFNTEVPVSDQVSLLRKEWQPIFSGEPFAYHFLDESVATQYINEEKAITLFTIFSSLTVTVSCLGLLGLCTLAIAQRKKEVGIRKIVGASFVSIISLFSKEYLILIGCAFVIVSPACLFLMNRWLESFPFRESVDFSIFIMTGGAVVALALLTITLGIVKTTSTNPSALIRE